MSVTLDRPRRWSSSTYFVLVTLAVLTNLSCFWRLPGLIAAHGGSAFVAVYVLAMAFFGLPLFAGQLYLARGTNLDVPGVVSRAGRAIRVHRLWLALAWLAVVAAALAFVVVLIVASWSLAFGVRALAGGLATDSPEAAQAYFAHFIHDSARGWGWLILLAALLVAIAARGLKAGVEPVVRTAAIALLFGILGLGAVMLGVDGGVGALADSWVFDWRALSVDGVLQALYQAFFSLGLGSGLIVVFGSYLAPDTPCLRMSAVVVGGQTILSLITAATAGMVLGQVAYDPGLGLLSAFAAVPAAHGNGPITAVFFVLLGGAAITTAIGLFEPLVLVAERRLCWSRPRAAVLVGSVLTPLALLGVLSFGPLDDWWVAGRPLFDAGAALATQVLLPLTALLLCGITIQVFKLGGLSANESLRIRAAWLVFLRYPARIGLLLIVVYATGVLAAARAFWAW